MKEIKWYVFYGFPHPTELGRGFDSLADAIHAVTTERITKWDVLIESSSFGIGGCHRVVWNVKLGKWVNRRTGITIEQEGWV